MSSVIALLHGPDQPGLVAKVSNWIWNRNGNILHADQHRDYTFEVFFQRVEWIPGSSDLEQEILLFREFAKSLEMEVQVTSSNQVPRVAIFVSKYDHCFHDIILRWKSGEFRGELVSVISNHQDLEKAAIGYGLNFHYLPIDQQNKAEVEQKQIQILEEQEIDLAILARYMQVLSKEMLDSISCPVINVHHSFLPAFAGARPYHKAHERGVKIIGATSHYATADLDEGPIISQVVTSVNHRHTVQDLVRKGRDLEKLVLAQAVRFHLEQRVLCYSNKTVVFD